MAWSMGQCEHCGADTRGSSKFECNFCGKTHCLDHRLPEKHRCLALTWSDEIDLVPEGRAEHERSGPKHAASTASASSTGASAASERTFGEHGKECLERESKPEKTPCEECGRPCPRGETYCSPCQKDIRARQRQPASTEEIRDHWRKNQPYRDSPELPRYKQFLGALPGFWTVLYYGILLALAYLAWRNIGTISQIIGGV